MKKSLVLLLLIACSHSVFSQTVHENYLDGKVYVKFKKATLKTIAKENPKNIPLSKLTVLESLVSKYGISKASIPFYQASDDEHLPYILKLEFSQIYSANAFIKELSSLEGMDYAEKVSLMKTDATTPNDFSISSASVHLTQINAQNAWDIFNGTSTVVVAVVDNAVMWNHVDLIGNTYTNTAEVNGITGVDDDGNGYIDDIHGWNAADNTNDPSHPNLGFIHGTHCAGIAGASTNNSTGIASIGWNIRILPIQAEPDASNNSANVSYGYEGIIYAVKSKARIISCSWGNNIGALQTEQYVIDYAWNRGCIVIASAGNFGNSTQNYPGAYNHVYCVAAVNASDVIWSSSNYGTWVDIAAPGFNIYSTLPYTGTPSYGSLSGTSMSTPMVAGLAGLMLSKSPNMTQTNVLNCISSTAANIYTLSGNSGVTNGHLGAGRIDAFAAMTCAATFSALPPVANFYAVLPFACPNVAIPFKDSSLYAPTGWSWIFQGGTPATSTSSNPSVMWSTPGAYSVSLIATNASGNNTKTKLSYVTVAGPSALPFSEGFQTATFLPTNWVANNIFNDAIYWERVTGIGGFGTSTACASFNNFVFNAPGELDEMRTPKFDFSNVATANLKFDVAYARYNAAFSDTLEVRVSTNCGTTWTSIYLKGGTALSTSADQGAKFVPTSSQWRTENINISVPTAGQGNVMFSFLNRGHYGQPIYLDNVNLSFPMPTLNANNNASICVTPTYTFVNNSAASASYTWNFQGGTPATSTATNPSVTYASPGTYTFSISGINGTSSTTVTKTITVLSNPVISTGASSYCIGNTYTLNGSGAASYTWSGSAGSLGNTPSLVFTPLASTFFTLTGSNGACTAQGIYIINTTQTPTFTISHKTACLGNSITLQALGAGSYSWSTGNTTNSILVSPGATTVYTVTSIGPACNTVKTVSVVIIPYPLSTLSTTNASCANSCNGIINSTPVTGSGPYTYSFSGNLCTYLPCTGLCAGTYSMIVTNAGLCSVVKVFTVTAPNALQSSISGTDAACSGCATGILSVNANGGTAPYTYTWNPSGGNTATATNLPPGCYTVTIEDANGCQTENTTCVSIVSNNTGLNHLALNGALLIYPNPAQNIVTVEIKGRIFNCSVYNNLGQLILNKTDNQDRAMLDLSGFAKGVYLIEVESENEKNWRKLLVE